MAEIELPGHIMTRRRDGRRVIVLHRSLAVIGPESVEIKTARSTTWLPLTALLVVCATGVWIVSAGGTLPFWLLVALLLFCLVAAPLSVMSLVSAFFGADVVADAKKGSVTWQQGFLGMGVGTRELVPFEKVDHLEVTIEGDDTDRWRGEADALRQFALALVKTNGRRLTIAQVPVPAGTQEDGMDRVLATAQALSALTGSRVDIPAGWQLVEVDAETGNQLRSGERRAGQKRRRRKTRG